MEIITAAGKRVLEKAGDGTAMVMQIVSFFVVYRSAQLIINNIITNALGFASRGIQSINYAPYDASWLVAQQLGTVSLRGEFFIIAFMNSAFQFLLSALIGYELMKTDGMWCPPLSVKDAKGGTKRFSFGPLSTLFWYAIPQVWSEKSRHVHANANHSVLAYVFLWIILAIIDIWSTTMFRAAVTISPQFPSGLNPALVPISIGMSVLYNIVLAEFALLISGGIAIATATSILTAIWGKLTGIKLKSKSTDKGGDKRDNPKPPVTMSRPSPSPQSGRDLPTRPPARDQRPSGSGSGFTGGMSGRGGDLFSQQGITVVGEYED